jgi:hypothetical protein
MNDELERMWKEAVAAYYSVLFQPVCRLSETQFSGLPNLWILQKHLEMCRARVNAVMSLWVDQLYNCELVMKNSAP